MGEHFRVVQSRPRIPQSVNLPFMGSPISNIAESGYLRVFHFAHIYSCVHLNNTNTAQLEIRNLLRKFTKNTTVDTWTYHLAYRPQQQRNRWGLSF